ncbi:MAG: hypothetical protein IJE08_13175, partial [Clostridia bacterium]|nr:hypothetical protein [Clostridia bacterium]
DQLGFDFNWNSCLGGRNWMMPGFESKIIRVEENGAQIVQNGDGLLTRVMPGVVSIPSEIDTMMTGREAWDELYKPKFMDSEKRVNAEAMARVRAQDASRDIPLGLHCGSLYGNIRNMLGVEELSYLAVDDEELYEEIIDTVGNLACSVVKRMLDTGVEFDYAHFWEDICFNTGPLVHPEVFRELVGPHYKKITQMVNERGIDIVSVDCDGKIDLLLPVWLENGVNTMFPIEVGTWNASIAPWRAKYGRELRGVGGMNKTVFAKDKAAVDAEIERLKPLIDLGGYIPCPDHRIAPDAKYELVEYYCDQFRKAFC